MPRISNTNGRRMVALDLTPREQRGPYEMHDNFSPIDPPHPDLAGWALQVAISTGGDAVGTRRTKWSGFADTHNRLSSRCQSVVWFLTLRPSRQSALSPVTYRRTAPTVRRAGNPDSDQRGGNRFPDEPFELSGAQDRDRAQGVFPQPLKTVSWAQPVDIQRIKPIGRLSDSVR